MTPRILTTAYTLGGYIKRDNRLDLMEAVAAAIPSYRIALRRKVLVSVGRLFIPGGRHEDRAIGFRASGRNNTIVHPKLQRVNTSGVYNRLDGVGGVDLRSHPLKVTFAHGEFLRIIFDRFIRVLCRIIAAIHHCS